MLERIGLRFESFVRRFMPDPFVLAIALTLLTFVLARCLTGHGFVELFDFWLNGSPDPDAVGKGGFWSLLDFAMQMVLIVVTGEAVARAPLVQRGLVALASIPRTAFSAAAFVSFVAMSVGWFHWGLGLIVAARLACEVAAQMKTRGVKLHYPLIGAAAYTALLIWHAGLSGSAPLKVNESGHFFVKLIGVVGLRQTVLTPMNLIACGLLLLLVPLIVAGMTPPPERSVEASDELLAARNVERYAPDRSTLAGRIDAAWFWSWAIALAGVVVLAVFFAHKGFDLNLNIVNFAMLIVGMALHGSPVAYMKAAAQSMKGVTGIVVQFPFYGGIMGVMMGSHLNEQIAGVFVQLASAKTLPFFTYLSSVISKLFIPSGGGEWAVEGLVMMKAAKTLNADVGKTVMAVAYGNMVGNMFQPFWALPLLGIMGLKAKEIMGYCLVIFCVACPVLGGILLLF
ncbi:MAG TPA: TIGR00366 family protein [Planctomycetota bacterium]|nr:TIGR00366 family protein [Planctomycetota bacterium]